MAFTKISCRMAHSMNFIHSNSVRTTWKLFFLWSGIIYLLSFYYIEYYVIWYIVAYPNINLFILVYFRNSLGRNDNPNATEFASAFEKLLVCHPVMTSVDHNVITNATGILTVSSKIKNKSKPSVVVNQPDVLELELDYDMTMLGEIESVEPYQQHMCAYIALCVEDKYIQNTKQHKNKCTECANILLASNDKINKNFLQWKMDRFNHQLVH